jgi:hypothetical protein
MNISFYKIDEDKLISYYYFSSQVSNYDLLELNSFKIRNILSLSFNKLIRDIILDNLFDESGTFLSNETKDNLFRYLSSEERNDLKVNLSNYLDYQIESEWYDTINKLINNSSINTILIPSIILKHEILSNQLNLLFPNKIFIDWHNYNETTETIILDYNHAWNKYNILTIQNPESSALFLSHYFNVVFEWKSYNEEKHIFNRINSRTRELIFGNDLIKELKEKLSFLRPKSTLNEWDLLHESTHKNSYNPQEEVLIYYSSNNYNKYKINSSFLLKKDNNYILESVKNIIGFPEKFENQFYFSNLENIINQVDLSEVNKAIEKDSDINRLIQPLWLKYNLSESDGRLWKQLLRKKVDEFGIYKVFSDIENISGIKQFISINTFENAYCNPNNNTIIPREKKIFKAICKYLELPLEYRAAIHRERNLIGGHSQELHSKLKVLIQSVIENGVLNKHNDDDELLEILNNKIDIIEKNVDIDFFGFTKESLLYACIAICYEIVDKMRLKPIVKIEYLRPN